MHLHMLALAALAALLPLTLGYPKADRESAQRKILNPRAFKGRDV